MSDTTIVRRGTDATVVNRAESATVMHRTDATVVVGTGAVGPQGPPGVGGGASFEFTQGSPATSWTINHNLGFRPAVELFTSGGVEMNADVTHMSVNQVVVSFSTATAGFARLN